MVTARAGLIIPSSNRMVEQEMIQAFPQGVQAHVTRLRMTGANRTPLAQVLPRVEEATRSLTDARCDVVAFHCTANSMDEGPSGEQRLLAAMAGTGAAQVTTTATAIRAALDALDAKRIVLLTPYDQKTTDHEAEFLHECGYQVLQATGFAFAGSDAYCATPPAFWRDRMIEAVRPDADVYFVSCANISMLGIIDAVEAEIGTPVITSNQAVVWDCLVRIGCADRRGCPGRLFQTRDADRAGVRAVAS